MVFFVVIILPLSSRPVKPESDGSRNGTSSIKCLTRRTFNGSNVCAINDISNAGIGEAPETIPSPSLTAKEKLQDLIKLSELRKESRRERNRKCNKSNHENSQMTWHDVQNLVAMYLGLSIMGIFVAFWGILVIPWLNLSIYNYRYHLLYRSILRRSVLHEAGEDLSGEDDESITNENEKIKPTSGTSKSRPSSFNNRVSVLLSSVPLTLLLLMEMNLKVEGTVPMTSDCTELWMSGRNDRSCYPRKAVDDYYSGDATLRNAVINTYGHIEDWDMSKIKNINYLFYMKASFNGDLSKWVTTDLVNMQGSKFNFFLFFVLFKK